MPSILCRAAAATALLFPLLLAQAPLAVPRVQDGGTRERLVPIYIPTLPGAPFTATVNTQWVKYLGNGGRITLVNHRLIARDRDGRLFQERRWFVPIGGNQESELTSTEITDPKSQEQYVCRPQTNTCELDFHAAMPVAKPQSKDALGTQTVAGIATTGYRQTTEIPANTIGNDSPMQVRRENWFSPQLGFNLLSTVDDTRFGTQRFELSEIKLSDPDPALFSPPAGMRVVDLRSATINQ